MPKSSGPRPPSQRLYGRSKGRPLSSAQTQLMQNVYPKIAVDVSKKGNVLAGIDRFEQVWFEIGFGGAEHLIWQAKEHPNCFIIGAEPFLNGVCKAVAGVEDNALSNVHLYHGDAHHILEKMPDAALDKVFILFPDPWPKARHNKRRLISDAFVAEIYRVLKPNGKFRFGSDIIHYVDWSLTRIHAHGGFEFPHTHSTDWRIRPDDWPSTRYLEKALREGRSGHFFEFIKQDRH